MNEDGTIGSFPFWPALLLVLAFDLFLCVEIHSIARVTSRIETNLAGITKRSQLMESQMSASKTWQTMLEGIANDLLDLAKTDSDIRKVVDKYQIRRNQPVTPPESKDKDKDSKPAE